MRKTIGSILIAVGVMIILSMLTSIPAMFRDVIESSTLGYAMGVILGYGLGIFVLIIWPITKGIKMIKEK